MMDENNKAVNAPELNAGAGIGDLDPASMANAQELYTNFADMIRGRTGRDPSCEEISAFLCACRILRTDENFHKYIEEPDPEGNKAKGFVDVFMEAWKSQESSQEFSLSHSDMCAFLAEN